MAAVVVAAWSNRPPAFIPQEILCFSPLSVVGAVLASEGKHGEDQEVGGEPAGRDRINGETDEGNMQP